MTNPYLYLVFFVYGLAFFSMGLIVALEGGRASDARLRHALRPLAAFGLIHGAHEWIEMLELLHILPGQERAPLAWESLRLAILAFSFLSLAAFGASLLAPNERIRRISLLLPLTQSAVWGMGLLVARGRYPVYGSLWDVADVWTRYVLAIPAALAACTGLVAQQRAFRQAGMVRFGRDSLWAAVAFAWYGIIGQALPRQSPLPPSTVLNQELFQLICGFPIQLLRAVAASVVAVFVMRFLRAFEVETRQQIAELQAARLREADRREALRGEFLRRVVTAQEAERQRVARELHDETGQALTALGIGLRGVAATLRQDVEQAASNLRQLEGMAVNALEELQRLIADLRPSQLDDLGLPAALRWYAKEIQHRSAVQVDVHLSGDERSMRPAIETALFRMAQEALTNIVKHADAKHAVVCLAFGPTAIELRVQDDGCGFDMNIMSDPTHEAWGLMGMRERTELLGGLLRLASAPGSGTEVSVTIPYTGEEHEDGDQVAVGG